MFPRQTLSQTAHDELEGGQHLPAPQGKVATETTNTQHHDYNEQLRNVFVAATHRGTYNAEGARVRVPSGLCISAWREYLADYNDPHLVDFLEFGWPVNFYRGAPLASTATNHPSATRYPTHIEH